jgi:hypothetical protein
MGDLSDFRRGQIVGAHLAGASVNKTATLLGLSRAMFSKVMTSNTNHEKKSSAERDSDRNPNLCARDRRTLKRISSKNYRATAAKVMAELNIHPKDPVSTKTVRDKLHKSNTHGRPAITKRLIPESNDTW